MPLLAHTSCQRATLFAADEFCSACGCSRLNFYLGQTDPAGYHLANLVLHLLASLLFLAFTNRLFGPYSCRRRQLAGGGGLLNCSTISALLFAVHPVHTEAVTSVVGRAELLSAVFLLAGES